MGGAITNSRGARRRWLSRFYWVGLSNRGSPSSRGALWPLAASTDQMNDANSIKCGSSAVNGELTLLRETRCCAAPCTHATVYAAVTRRPR